jgi:ribosome-interacting GTPase 1
MTTQNRIRRIRQEIAALEKDGGHTHRLAWLKMYAGQLERSVHPAKKAEPQNKGGYR